MHALGLPPVAGSGTVPIVKRILLSLALLMLAGCVTPPPPAPPPAPPSDAEAVSSRETFVTLDKAAVDSVAVVALESHTLLDGRLEVLASLKNRTAGPVRLGIACYFKTAAGAWLAVASPPAVASAKAGAEAEAAGAVSWRPLVLAGAAVETLTFDSADARAERFTIAARGAR